MNERDLEGLARKIVGSQAKVRKNFDGNFDVAHPVREGEGVSKEIPFQMVDDDNRQPELEGALRALRRELIGRLSGSE